MTAAASRLLEQVAALAHLLDGGVGAIDDRGMRDAVALLGAVERLTDAVGVEVGGELERRSAESGLAGRWGYRNAVDAVAIEGRLDPAVARAWCVVGEAVAPRVSFLGEVLPAARPELDAAATEGTLSAGALARIVDTLDEVDRRAPGRAAGLVPVLLAEAATLPPRQFVRVCRYAIDRADPDGVELREEELRRRTDLRVRQLPDGMLHFDGRADPENGGFLLAALDARTAPRRVPRFRDADGRAVDGRAVDGAADTLADGAVEDDPRTLGQRRFDALISILRESLRADDGDVAGVDVTMLVTIPLETLTSGVGAATIAGIDAPISAGTARRLAGTARIIPVVLGGESEPLDVGRAARLFTPAQRRALAVRDGGCVWPGCDAPPGWCEVAHIRAWADDGPTDLDNGMLMCPFHHRRFDNDGWTLEHRDGRRWLIPPPWVDVDRRPRPLGRPVHVLAGGHVAA